MILDGSDQYLRANLHLLKETLRKLVQLGLSKDEFIAMIDTEIERDKRERLSIP